MKNKETSKSHVFLKEHKTKSKFSKTFCLFLMAVFTLVMIADIVNLFVTPAQSQMRFGPGGSEFQMPEGGERPGSDFQMPEGGEMPGGDFRIPENASGDGETAVGERPSFGGMPGGNRSSRQSGFLQTVRNAWLPIVIACALGDVVCWIILLRLRRTERAGKEALEGVPGMPLPDEEEEDSDGPPQRKRGPWTAILCLATAFAMILAMIPTEDTDASSVRIQSQVISGTAEAARINTVLSGAGTLEADVLTPVTVPQQVTVLKYHVRNGETVTTGTPLVSVDKTSAASAMRKLHDVLDDLDKDLEAQRQASNASCIYSSAAGRVKKIYASSGDTVTDVLYKYGALMLLSLDGTMKVTFESGESLTVGDAVTVQYSGIAEEGRIASVREGKITVTLSDEKAPYGGDATIVQEGGKTIGQGKLEISSALKVIGYYGTVDTIPVSAGSKVGVGTSLLTLKDTGYTTDYQLLLARRNVLEKQMQKLSTLAQTGMVYAENDGIVSGVPEDAEIELHSGSGSQTANTLSASSSGWQLMLLSNVANSHGENDPTWDGWLDHFSPGGEDPDAGSDSGSNAGDDSGDSDGSDGETSLSGNYAASLYQYSGGTLYIWYRPTAVTEDASSLDLTTMQSEMTQFHGFACSGIADADITLTENGETKTVKLTDLQQEDLLLLTFSENIVTNVVKAQRAADVSGDPAEPGDSADPSEPAQGEGDQVPGGAAGGMSSGGGSMGGMPSTGGMTVQKSYDQYIAEEPELLYVSDQEEIAVTISVDELDILSLERGLEAQVTLDAMQGQAFTGSIARISNEGTSDGGNAKFSVTILLPREATMLDGMNASVKIVTGTSHAAVSIPAAALVEEDGKTYVYTDYNKETDTLDGLTEVVTGTSDGELTEVLSGVEVGDTFYYRYADTVTYSFLTTI